MKLFLIYIIIILLFLILFINYDGKNHVENKLIQISKEANGLNNNTTQKTIPKLIWSFWDSENLPPIVQKCKDSWKKYNPDYDIHIINKENIHNYVSKEFDIFSMPHNKNSIARSTDFLRLYLLYNYGGFWLDASIFLNESLNTFVKQKCDIAGFYLDGFTSNSDYPIIESWFIGSSCKNLIIKLWLDCFLILNNFHNVEDYIKWIRSNEVDLQKIDNPEYLSIHSAAQLLFQKILTPKQINDYFFLLKAEDGPYLYLTSVNWNSEKAFDNTDNLRMPIVKLRGIERNVLEKNQNLLSRFLSL